MHGRILVVDDDPVVLSLLREVLSMEGYDVREAADAETALKSLPREPADLVLCDVRLPGMDGFALLRELRRTQPGADVVLMTGYASVDGAVDAMENGAADYLIKPLKPKEIVARLNALFERRRLEAELQKLEGELRSRFDMHNVVARSPRMIALAAALRRVSPNDGPVILFGEHGTGRGFLGRVMHYSSPRRDAPFAWLACDQGGDRVGDELFGRVRASRHVHRGHIERLRGGTLHLREAQTLPRDVQETLGTCLRTGTWRRIGGEKQRPLGARLVLSLPAPVSELLERGDLHPDLACLQEHVAIHVPPLRERREDVPGLVAAFLESYAAESGRVLRIDSDAAQLLEHGEYPGNVAQLFAVLRHAALTCQDGVLDEEAVANSLRQTGLDESRTSAPIAEALGDRERQLVAQAVHRHPGHLDQAAKDLGISRTTLWRRMRKYGIRISAH